jgi:hypothetical protein
VNPTRHGRFGACHASLTTVLVVVIFGLGACSRGGEDDTTSASKKLPPPQLIERIEGMKYYVGGPMMQADRYGRSRLANFNGEVSAPTSRGLLIGFKVEGKKFDYRTYINGRMVSSSTGFLDDEKLLWFDERFTYDFSGKVIARQTLSYDDASEMMTSSVEHMDAVSGEVVTKIDQKIPYAPAEDDDEDSDSLFDDEQEEGEGEDAPN